MKPVFIDAFTATTCAGRGISPLLDALKSGTSGLTPCCFDRVKLNTWVGQVTALDEPEQALPERLSAYDCRNNRLAWLGLQQDGFHERAKELIRSYGTSRVGLFLGTSTSGIYETELAFRSIDSETGQFANPFNYSGAHSISSLWYFIREVYAIDGPGFLISTACSSSAKSFAAAQRFIAMGLIDAAIVGGVDSLCLTTLYGFNSLQLTSSLPCRPCDTHRNGISIGEAAGFALLTKQARSDCHSNTWLLGYGESSDAYHMSTPHPDGLGGQIAMQQAVNSAGLSSADIDYINLHGTATPSNDRSEGIAVNALFGGSPPCSSTKGVTGHTLGAAGALEAIICLLSLQHGFVPGSANTVNLDPAIQINYLLRTRPQAVKRVISNSFGFGGSNCSLIFGQR